MCIGHVIHHEWTSAGMVRSLPKKKKSTGVPVVHIIKQEAKDGVNM